MNIQEFKEQIYERWDKHPKRGELGGRKPARITPFAHALIEAICRRVNSDKEERMNENPQSPEEAEEQASHDLQLFASWRGWDKTGIIDWDVIQLDSIDESVVELYRLLNRIKQEEAAWKKAAGLPSESDLEDAYNTLDAIALKGSPKQIKWARSITWNANHTLATLWKQGLQVRLPESAAWWIDNRDNLLVALRDSTGEK